MIRLMNVSLSPNDTLGRMLHNFSATGYECADHTPLSLVNLGFLNFDINKAKTDVPDATLGIKFELGASRLGWGREVIERSVEA